VEALGVDIGGSGIKGSPVDTSRGAIMHPVYRVPTPSPATPAAIADVVVRIIDHFRWTGRVGCGFPAPIVDSVVQSAVNVDDSWVGINGVDILNKATGTEVALLNDADAAGLAEMRYGAGYSVPGTVLILTFGTGVGSAIFVNGNLAPNTELGLAHFGTSDVEEFAAARIRTQLNLSDAEWAGRVSMVLNHFENLLNPSLFIIGGGISRRWSDYADMLSVRTRIVPAAFTNEAGIVGAAMFAVDSGRRQPAAGSGADKGFP